MMGRLHIWSTDQEVISYERRVKSNKRSTENRKPTLRVNDRLCRTVDVNGAYPKGPISTKLAAKISSDPM